MARATSGGAGPGAPAPPTSPAEAADRLTRLAPRRLRALRAEHRQLALLCDMLEAIADALPRPNAAQCRNAMHALDEALPRHHAAEAGMMTALIGPARPDLLGLIRRQHDEDEGMAAEIAGALAPLAEGAAPDGAETLGYMLRCFFTSYRRAMLIEELAIDALAADAGTRARSTPRSGGLGHRLEP